MITQLSTSLYDQCLAEYEVRSQLGAPGEPGSLKKLRSKAIEVFSKLGFPSTRTEEWKYTSLAPVLSDDYDMEQDEEIQAFSEEWIKEAVVPGLKTYTLITVNGRFRPDLSDSLPGGQVQALPIQSAFEEPSFRRHFGNHIDFSDKNFPALNTALFRNGLFLEFKTKARPDRIIHVIHVRQAASPVLIQPRHLIVVGDNAEAALLESYITVNGSAPLLVNEVTELTVGANARFSHYYIQEGNEASRQIQHTQTSQQASSLYNQYKASFPGPAFLRNNNHVVLDGKNIESHLYGIYLCGGHQLVDNHTLVDHRMPHCLSNELYKGVMNDEASGIFNGKIFVRQDAQKTNAFQQNNNLMLSDRAVVDSKPQLEIFADDVKCSHGTTVGQFDEDALFYLRTRGIGAETAKKLMVHAFLYDVTQRIPVSEIREYVNELIGEGLMRNA